MKQSWLFSIFNLMLIRKITLFVLLQITIMNTFAQPWVDNYPKDKPKSEYTLFDYKKTFDDYWAPHNVKDAYYFDESGKREKASGWKQFLRWYYYMEGIVNPETGEIPKITAQEVYNNYKTKRENISPQKSANWTSLGPVESDGGYAGIGRLISIEFHPNDNNFYWVGAPAGGLWQTTNNGQTWICLTDNNNVLGVNDIVVPPDFAASNTIYIATGDRAASDNYSIGVLKSTDGGQTWNNTGLTYSLNQSRMTTRLLMDPNNNQTLLAATTDGVFKTVDGGNTWSEQLTTTSFIDMEFKPGDFNTIYGSDKTGKIFVSTDGGANWSNTSVTSGGQRIEIAVSSDEPAWIYAVVANGAGGLQDVLKSIDSGATWTSIKPAGINMLGYYTNGTSDTGGQGWYDLCIAASPSDANSVFVGGVNTWRSLNGGQTWAAVNCWVASMPYNHTGVDDVHADKHMLKFRSNGDLFEANDGGIYISTNNGSNWTDKTNGMVISQIYKIGVSATDEHETITGLQDNGTKLYLGESKNHVVAPAEKTEFAMEEGVAAWWDIIGGDGMECLIDYTNVNIQYGEIYYGDIRRTTNHWNSSVAIRPNGAGDGAWVTPIIIDPVNPQILYAGYANVWKTTNRGNTWTQISNLSTGTNKIRAMAISQSNNQVMYITNLGVLWKTVDGGTQWTVVTSTLPVNQGPITSICIHAANPNTVWVTIGGYNTHGVYQTLNGGETWENISAGLPELPMYSIVQNMQVTAGTHLYVGSELGIYFKNGSEEWIPYNTGLPNVKIGELDIYYNQTIPEESKLRAGTYGRGLWESNVFSSQTAMTYVSSTATQPETAGIRPGETNKLIMGMEIVTEGYVLPLTLSQLTVSMEGTTNIADISTIKVYYTGNSSVFTTENQYGQTAAPSEGNITFTQDLELLMSTNYLWLVYDLPENATIGNTANANFISVKIGNEIYTPIITNPGTGRQIVGYPEITLGTEELDFGYVPVGSSKVLSYTVSGVDLVAVLRASVTSGFSLSRNPDSGFTTVISFTPVEGTVEETTVYARFSPTSERAYTANVSHTSTDAERKTVSVKGNGTLDIADCFNPEIISVYPNPSNGQFTISNPNMIPLEYQVTDIKGQLIFEQKVNAEQTNTIDLSRYADGVYIVRFTTKERLYNIRLVKQ